jgi:hypothetical protein
MGLIVWSNTCILIFGFNDKNSFENFNIVKSMLNYYLRLEKTGSTFPLLNDAYIESKLLHNAKKSSWYSSVKLV